MIPFSALLSRTTLACNRRGALIAWGMAVFGACLLFAHVVAAQQLGERIRPVAEPIVGVERFAQLQTQWRQSGYSSDTLQSAVDEVSRTFAVRIAHLPQAAKDAQTDRLVTQATEAVGASLALYLLVLGVLQLLAHGYFLVIAVREPTGPDAAWMELMRRFFPLLAVWILIFLLCGGWLPVLFFALAFAWPPLILLCFLSFIVPAILLPRLLFAPVLLLQDHQGVIASIRGSYDATRGKWLTVVYNVVGAAVAVWIATTLAGVLIDTLIQILLPYSPSAPWLSWLLVFISLLAVAYRTMFLVELKQEMLRPA